MANEGIRLPSDTTVASQKVHRGSQARDTQITPATPKEVATPQTLITVVLQTKPLIEGSRSGLFELLLQNDPKSEPPIRLQSDTRIAPGTSLLLELDDQGVYRPIERPSRAQLTQMIQLELDFWRAHLLPKADQRSFPPTPEAAALTRIGNQWPELKPLTEWLTQRPETITGREMQRWFRETSPLSHLRNWQLTPSTQETSARQRTTPTADVSRVLPLPSPIAAQHPALNYPIGTRVNINPLPPNGLAPATAQTDRTSNPSVLTFAGRVFTLTTAPLTQPVSPVVFHDSVTPIRATLAWPSLLSTATTTATPTTQNQPSNLSTQAPTGSVSTGTPATSVTPVPVHFALTPVRSADHQPALQLIAQVPQPITSTDTGSRAPLQTLPLPRNLELLPQRRDGELPIEMKLGLWLQQLDKTVAQHPATLQSQMQGKAEEILRNMELTRSTPDAVTRPSTDAASDNDAPLLALRNLLDSTLARIQNNAIQTAAQQVTQPDQPVQQMQLPLIWLGLTSWADIEWWQERPKKDKKQKDQDESRRRRWRMKIYLTLTPLGQVCADLDWGPDQTQLTFWSEDPATLNHLNQLLPTLNQWTEGLGERNLSTKHGMPSRRQNHRDDEPSHHLVDIKT